MPSLQDRALSTVKVIVTTSDTILAFSPAMRKHLIIENRGPNKCYVSFGAVELTDTDNGHELSMGERLTIGSPGTCEIHARTDAGTCDVIVSEG
jgi:hypothetical protein